MSQIENFGINGRFLAQSPTGVQRYALNVSLALSSILSNRSLKLPLLVPAGTDDPHIPNLPIKMVGRSGGHVWEQLDLPRAWPDRLLNLCNTAPAFKAEQIVCIHDANVFLAAQSYNFSFRAFYRMLQPTIARRSARIATVSKFSAEQIAKYLSIREADIVVLPNGHDHVHKWNPKNSIKVPLLLNQSFERAHRPFVLALGSQARHKNLKLLFAIAPELAKLGVDLVVAGGHSGIFEPEKHVETNNIRSLGFVTDDDLAYLLDRALCLAFPSFTEGFGLPVLEAMARGCPVVSSDRASMPEICGGAALLASPCEPLAWIAHISGLLVSSTLREDLIGRGRMQAKLYNWSDTAQGYMDLMENPSRRDVGRRDIIAFPRIAVIVATLGRPQIVSGTIRRILASQTIRPEIVVISCVKLDDAGEAASWPGVAVVVGHAGLATQRNTGLSFISSEIDIVVFFDDDFVPHFNWLEIVANTFREEKDVAGVTGAVLADGIKGPGLSFEETDQLLQSIVQTKTTDLIESFSPYGCNMAFRHSAIRTIRFDERLVLYGWLEDRDFGANILGRGGRIVKCCAARGVHMGVKTGRISGDRLGYSQIINPIYLLGKKSMTISQVLGQITRNFLSNLIRSISPEPYIDRRGRLRGNILGFSDALRGRIDPERATKIRSRFR
ncbi:glycosyltransferase [Methylobacterium mesophilicum]